jgi:Outer membrane protein beta-barrel domain
LKKSAVVFLFSILAVCDSLAEGLQLSGKAGMWSFSTTDIRATDDSASGFGAYSLQLSYAVAEKWNACLGFNMLMSDGISGSQGFGIDAGANYYPFTAATSTQTQVDNVSIAMSETWRPYAGLHFRQRTFNFILATTFLGTGLAVGVDYQIGTKWFLNFETRYDMLFGADEGKATQINLLLGAGLEF